MQHAPAAVESSLKPGMKMVHNATASIADSASTNSVLQAAKPKSLDHSAKIDSIFAQVAASHNALKPAGQTTFLAHDTTTITTLPKQSCFSALTVSNANFTLDTAVNQGNTAPRATALYPNVQTFNPFSCAMSALKTPLTLTKAALFGLSLCLLSPTSQAYSLDQAHYNHGKVATPQSTAPHQPSQIDKQRNVLSQRLPPLQKPLLNEIARLSLNQDLLLIFGADEFYTFLGCVNCAPSEALSIWNPYGPYGSTNSQMSIWSTNYEFGNASAQVCPWNAFGRNPPFLIDTQGKVHGTLTLNQMNTHRNVGQVANFLYQNHEQIKLDQFGWFKSLFKDTTSPVVVIPETAKKDGPQPMLNLDAPTTSKIPKTFQP